MKHYRTLVSKTLALCIFVISLAFSNPVSAQTMVQTPISTYINSMIGGYYEALPSDYNANPNKKYPLLVFLHGAGEVGNGSPSQLPLVLHNGPPKLINQGTFPGSFSVNGQSFSFIVISPQLTGRDETGNAIQSLIDYIVAHYRVDQSRIYLTGLSMGGGSTWIYSATYAGSARLAAIANMCGNSPPYAGQPTIVANANLAVWAFHNSDDPVCPISYTNDWIAQLNAVVPAINPTAKKTIFNAASHDCWTKGYDPNYRENNMNVYEWMLQYSRGTSTQPPPVNQLPLVNAGTDQTITLPVSSVTLNGTASDPDGTITSYAWSKVSGGTATITSPSSVSTNISGLTQGAYTFRLTVTDNGGATRTDDVIVNVNAAAGGGSTYTTIPGKVEAESSILYGVQLEVCKDAGGGQDAGWIDLGDYMDFNVNASAAGSYTLNFRIATPNTGAQFLVKNAAGTVLATVNVPNTGDYQVWQTTSATVTLPAGNQTLRVISNKQIGWNLNYVDFVAGATAPAPPPPTTPPPSTTTRVEAESYTAMSGIQTEPCTDAGGGQDIGWIDNNDWMDYSVTTAAAGTYTMNFRVASPYYGGTFQVKNAAGTVLTTVAVPNTGGYQAWQTVTKTVTLAAGTQTLKIVCTVQPWNINWFEVVSSASATGRTASIADSTATVTATAISVSPEVTTGRFVLTVNNTATGDMKILVTDKAGTVKREFGLAKTQSGSTQNYLSISDLDAGEYTITVQMGKWSESIKITKL